VSSAPSIAVFGGGLAGLASALALGLAGHPVTVFEARAFLGGRATSYPLNSAEGEAVTIDNCQHILLRCCQNLIDFYRRLGVDDRITFYPEFYWMEPGGRTSVMKRGMLPVPAHFAGSFASMRFLSLADKLAVARGLLAVRAEHGLRKDLDSISMLDWLREKKQTRRAIERFWRQVLVSAVNEELDIMAASHGLQVFYLGFLAGADCYEMGVPAIPLAQLYSPEVWQQHPNVQFRFRAALEHLSIRDGRVESATLGGESITADRYVLALPFERVAAIAPGLELDLSEFTHVPITGIHLWFDRAITDLPHVTFLDRSIQWLYNKEDGRHVQLVVSASRNLTEMSRGDVIQLALKELSEFFPIVKDAKLERSHVVKEMRATFSAKVGLESRRPGNNTNISNLFLAGDWTKSGWPSTMEGAVRSGYMTAEAVLESLGKPQRFLHLDPR
jgi:squalene-associated FAD-dependent desaturase